MVILFFMNEKGEVWNLGDILEPQTYESILKKIEENTKILES